MSIPKDSKLPKTGTVSMPTVMARLEEDIRYHHSDEKRKNALSWGIDSLDRLTLGLLPSRLAVLVSDSPAYPRWVVWRMVHQLVTRDKVPVVVATGDLSPERWLLNLALRAAGLSREDYWRRNLNQQALELFRIEIERLKAAPLSFISPIDDNLLSAAEEARNAHGARLLVVDPLSALLTTPNKSERKDAKQVMDALKDLATRTSLAVVVVHRTSGLPLDDDAAEDCYHARADLYAEVSWETPRSPYLFELPKESKPWLEEEKAKRVFEVHILHNLDGGSGRVRLNCDKSTHRLFDPHPRSNVQQLLAEMAREGDSPLA